MGQHHPKQEGREQPQLKRVRRRQHLPYGKAIHAEVGESSTRQRRHLP